MQGTVDINLGFRALSITVALTLGWQGALLAMEERTLKDPVKLKLAVFPAGTGAFDYGPPMAEVIKAALPAGSAVEVVPGSPVANVEMVSKGEVDLALTYTMTAKAGKEKFPNLRTTAA